MTGKYQSSRLERCFFCHHYINLDKDSHAIVAVGMHTQYIHTGMCFKLANKAHRLITLKEVHHGR